MKPRLIIVRFLAFVLALCVTAFFVPFANADDIPTRLHISRAFVDSEFLNIIYTLDRPSYNQELTIICGDFYTGELYYIGQISGLAGINSITVPINIPDNVTKLALRVGGSNIAEPIQVDFEKSNQYKANSYFFCNAGNTASILADKLSTKVTAYNEGLAVSNDATLCNGYDLKIRVPLASGGFLTEEFSVLLLGDANGDNEISATDSLLALQHSIDSIILTSESYLCISEITGKISSITALMVLQYSINLIDSL